MPASARRSSSSRRIVRLLEQLRLQRAAEVMAERERHRVSDADRKGALAHAAKRGLELSGEPSTAIEHMTGERDLGVVVGYAGTGKNANLGVAREAGAKSGLEVSVAATRTEESREGKEGRKRVSQR